jgi:hypothetical protein
MAEDGPAAGAPVIGRFAGVTPYARAMWIGMDPEGPMVVTGRPPSQSVYARSIVRLGSSGGESGGLEDRDQTKHNQNKDGRWALQGVQWVR